MGIKPQQSDAIGYLKGPRMTLVKSSDYIKVVHEKLKYPPFWLWPGEYNWSPYSLYTIFN